MKYVARQERNARGFTLIEIVIALAIFALMSTMAYSTLSFVVNNKSSIEESAERLSDLQTAFVFMGRDLDQVVARPVRDEFGDRVDAFVGEGGELAQLEVSRLGWRNPAQRLRSHVQRVAYRLEEEALVRFSWSVLDRAGGEEPLKQVLLEKVETFEMRFLDKENAWHDVWPEERFDETPTDTEIPRAIEVTVDYKGIGEVKRLFEVVQVLEELTPREEEPERNEEDDEERDRDDDRDDDEEFDDEDDDEDDEFDPEDDP